MERWRSVTAILAGRWQIPLAICALLAAAVALHRTKPPKREVPFEALLADVWALVEAGTFHDASNAAGNLLELEPPLSRRQRGVLHETLAEIIYRQEELRGLADRENAKLLLDHHAKALAAGRPPDARAALRVGQAHEWLGETWAAVGAYRTVLKRQPVANDRRIALQGLVRLLDGHAGAEDERRRCIQALLAEEGVSPGYIWWALQHAVQEALDRGDVERAWQLVNLHGARFKRSDLKGYYDYLCGWLHVHDGQTELAEPLLDRVDQWLIEHTEVDSEMHRAGYLPALSRWLRGRIHLDEARPQAALGCLNDALALQSHGDLLVRATIDRARALCMLERHENARQAVRETVARLEGDPSMLNIVRPRLVRSIAALADDRHEHEDFGNAIAYVELVLEITPQADQQLRLDLLERLGRENEAAAKVAEGGESGRDFHAAAARAYEQAADLAQLDEPRYAALLWASAMEFDRAGRMRGTQRMLRLFVKGRTLDPRMPQALLQLGRSLAVDGRLDDAIECYRRLIDDFPLLEEGWRARLLLADCLIACGQAGRSEAEIILRNLLEDEHVAPQAPVFRDALFTLCDLLYEQEQFAKAISYMEDFLIFYPADPERYLIHFMLADAYRQSAYALMNGERNGSEAARRRASRERFRRAAQLFGSFPEENAAAETSADFAVYERLALMYHGDCLYELNEPATLAEALATYCQAAARYEREPTALMAQIQIASTYLRQGKLIEAARAVERARWLLGSIPDQAFADYADGMGREFWDRYLNAVRSSQLFQDVFTSNR